MAVVVVAGCRNSDADRCGGLRADSWEGIAGNSSSTDTTNADSDADFCSLGVCGRRGRETRGRNTRRKGASRLPVARGVGRSGTAMSLAVRGELKDVVRKTKHLGVEVEVAIGGRVVIGAVGCPDNLGVGRSDHTVTWRADEVIRREVGPQVAAVGLAQVADVAGQAAEGSVGGCAQGLLEPASRGLWAKGDLEHRRSREANGTNRGRGSDSDSHCGRDDGYGADNPGDRTVNSLDRDRARDRLDRARHGLDWARNLSCHRHLDLGGDGVNLGHYLRLD